MTQLTALVFPCVQGPDRQFPVCKAVIMLTATNQTEPQVTSPDLLVLLDDRAPFEIQEVQHSMIFRRYSGLKIKSKQIKRALMHTLKYKKNVRNGAINKYRNFSSAQIQGHQQLMCYQKPVLTNVVNVVIVIDNLSTSMIYV